MIIVLLNNNGKKKKTSAAVPTCAWLELLQDDKICAATRIEAQHVFGKSTDMRHCSASKIANFVTLSELFLSEAC